MNLEKRIEQLEQRQDVDSAATVLILKFCGHEGEREPVAYTGSSYAAPGWRIDRADGETLESFKARASRAVPRNPGCLAVLVEDYGPAAA